MQCPNRTSKFSSISKSHGYLGSIGKFMNFITTCWIHHYCRDLGAKTKTFLPHKQALWKFAQNMKANII
jgi:hypothetical protein